MCEFECFCEGFVDAAGTVHTKPVPPARPCSFADWNAWRLRLQAYYDLRADVANKAFDTAFRKAMRRKR